MPKLPQALQRLLGERHAAGFLRDVDEPPVPLTSAVARWLDSPDYRAGARLHVLRCSTARLATEGAEALLLLLLF